LDLEGETAPNKEFKGGERETPLGEKRSRMSEVRPVETPNVGTMKKNPAEKKKNCSRGPEKKKRGKPWGWVKSQGGGGKVHQRRKKTGGKKKGV